MAKILVTGASGGIGAAISRALAARGATVLLHYQSGRDAAEATRRSLKGDGHALVQGDLSDPKAIERLWSEASARGRIDAVVNNAGIFPDHPRLPPTTRSGRRRGSARWLPTCSVPPISRILLREPWSGRVGAGS